MAVIHGTNIENNAVPSLDLRFADRKNLIDTISGSNLFTFSRSSSGTYVDAAGVIQSAATNVARFDHNPSTLESLGLLVEEARTNLLKYSDLKNYLVQAYTSAPTTWMAATDPPGGITINVTSAVNELGPDGLINVTKIAPNAGWSMDTGNPRVANGFYNSITLTGNNNITSVYFKPAGCDTLILQKGNYSTSNIQYTFNTSNMSHNGYSFTYVGNGWYRAVAAGDIRQVVSFGCSKSGGGAYNGIDGVLLWGAQLEDNVTFPTSYIPTPATFTGRTSTATYYDSAGVIQTALSGVARSDAFFPDSSGVMRPAGLLLEAAGTNLSTQSEDFTGKTVQFAGTITITPNNQVAPDGSNTADTATFSSDILNGRLELQISVVSGTTYTFSFFVKLLSGSASFQMRQGFLTKDFTATSSWQRVSLTFTASTTGIVGMELLRAVNGIQSSYAVWGHQVEASPYPTSYIPTVASTVTRSADTSTSATVTRSADVAQMTGANFSSWYNQSEGTMFYNWRNFNPANQFIVLSLTTTGITFSATQNEAHRIRIDSSNTMVYGSFGSSSATISLGINSYAANTPYKTSFAYKVNDFYFARNGAGASSLSGSPPLAIDSLNLMSARDSGSASGTIARLTYYPTRLQDATLQKLTR